MLKRFVIYGLLGWSTEIFWTGLGSLMSGDLTLAVDGLVTLAYAPAWFTVGLLFEQVHRTLDAYRIA